MLYPVAAYHDTVNKYLNAVLISTYNNIIHTYSQIPVRFGAMQKEREKHSSNYYFPLGEKKILACYNMAANESNNL